MNVLFYYMELYARAAETPLENRIIRRFISAARYYIIDENREKYNPLYLGTIEKMCEELVSCGIASSSFSFLFKVCVDSCGFYKEFREIALQTNPEQFLELYDLWRKEGTYGIEKFKEKYYEKKNGSSEKQGG